MQAEKRENGIFFQKIAMNGGRRPAGGAKKRELPAEIHRRVCAPSLLFSENLQKKPRKQVLS